MEHDYRTNWRPMAEKRMAGSPKSRLRGNCIASFQCFPPSKGNLWSNYGVIVAAPVARMLEVVFVLDIMLNRSRWETVL